VNTPCDVVTVGETMVVARAAAALRLGGTLTASVAGAESNVAIGLARLGHRVRWWSRLGDDEAGELVQRTLRAENVLLKDVVLDAEAPTGLMLTDRGPSGHVRVHYYRAGSAASRLEPADPPTDLLAGARLLHLTGVTPALGDGPARTALLLAERARTAGTQVSLDVNHRTSLWSRADAVAWFIRALPLVDVVVASEDELALLGPAGADETDLCSAVLTAGPRSVVVKRGARGASHISLDGVHDVAAAVVDVVDTTGAGDAFTAGYLSGLLDGLSVAERLARGVLAGGCAVASHGDWENLPTRRDLDLLRVPAGETLR
jgi:2-dehydro-3-deoxygluconokinase